MARKKKRQVGRPRKKRTAKRQRAVRGLANIPTSKLRDELDRRGEMLGKLEAERDQLVAKLHEIDQTLSEFGVSPASAGAYGKRRGPGRPPGSGATSGTRRRPRNEMNLVDALAKTLKGKTMGVSEVSDAVQKNGYKTTSPNFRTIVNQALITNTKVFRKVARGQYTAK